jgi:hypothetical protein
LAAAAGTAGADLGRVGGRSAALASVTVSLDGRGATGAGGGAARAVTGAGGGDAGRVATGAGGGEAGRVATDAGSGGSSGIGATAAGSGVTGAAATGVGGGAAGATAAGAAGGGVSGATAAGAAGGGVSAATATGAGGGGVSGATATGAAGGGVSGTAGTPDGGGSGVARRGGPGTTAWSVCRMACASARIATTATADTATTPMMKEKRRRSANERKLPRASATQCRFGAAMPATAVRASSDSLSPSSSQRAMRSPSRETSSSFESDM